MITYGFGFGISTLRQLGGSGVPADATNVVTEEGDNLITEEGDNVVTEEAP